MIDAIKQFFAKQNIEPEALKAYFHRLPNNIQVDWFRDNEFIVGKIKAGDAEFMTQAKSADEFVEMVNDAIFTVHEIPREYSDILLQYKKFKPNKKQFENLEDASIEKSQIRFVKQELSSQPA